MTPEQQAAMQKAQQEMKDWRLSVSMDKYKAFRKMFNDAGISIYAFKLPPTMNMSDQEYDYIWNVTETLGANHVTMELPTDDALLQRVGEYAAKRKIRIAFHTHGQGGDSGDSIRRSGHRPTPRSTWIAATTSASTASRPCRSSLNITTESPACT
jgi:hypothetical protein